MLRVLREDRVGRIVTKSGSRLLRSQEILGRSPECSLVVDEASVSGVHAVLSWTGTGWVLRDASSLNGTQVNGQAVGSGEAMRLGAGDRIRLGHADALALADAAPPVAHAVEASGQVLTSDGVQLCFEGSRPIVVVQDGRSGTWWAESPDDRWQVADGEHFEAGGAEWTLHLPRVVAPTQRGAGGPPQVQDLAAHFAVSPDEEHVKVVLGVGARTWELTPRVHHYTLLTLARERIRDQERGVPEEEQGWIDRQLLLGQLAINENLLYTHLFRARTEVGDLGFADAADLVQRRKGPGQLRIGIARLSVDALGA